MNNLKHQDTWELRRLAYYKHGITFFFVDQNRQNPTRYIDLPMRMRNEAGGSVLMLDDIQRHVRNGLLQERFLTEAMAHTL